MNWLVFSLLSACSLGSADAVTKRYFAVYTGAELVVVRFVSTGLILFPLLLWQFPTTWEFATSGFVTWRWVLILVPLELFAMWLYMISIRDSPLTLTLPYLAFTPVLTTLSGFFVLGERVSSQAFGGICFVAVGVYVLNSDTLILRDRGTWLTPMKAIATERGSRTMLIVAALYSVTSVVGKKAMACTPPMVFGSAYFVILGLASLGVFSIGNPRIVCVLWRRPVAHAVVGGLLAVMAITHFIAIEMVEVAYMITVKRTSMLFGIAYGAAFFGEKYVIRHMMGALLMLIGVALLVIP